MNYTELIDNKKLVNVLQQQAITEPTEIQEKVIPLMLEGKDVIGQAHTGSGKTLAYLLPVLLRTDTEQASLQTLILAPTHELVMQIYRLADSLSKEAELNVRCQSIIGEANINNQITKLKEKPHMIVGTPGRILDLIKKKKINCQTIRTVIIDEVDTLLDNSNRQTVQDILKSTLKSRQLAGFSATISDNSLNLLQEHMHDAVHVNVETEAVMNPNIDHYYFICEQRDKFVTLRKLLHALEEEADRILIFMNDGPDLDFLVDKLNYHKIKTYSLHGIVDKEERQKAMEEFRRGKIKILVSSDLAARGLDIPDITHVVNMDFPAEASEYIHRAGRTARGQRKGTCYNIVNAKELAALRIYQRDFEIQISPVHLVRGKILSGAVKEFYHDPNRKKNSGKTAKKNTTAPKGRKTTGKGKAEAKGHNKNAEKK